MLGETTGLFLSFFQNFTLVGFGLAIAFGVIWLAGYRPPVHRNPWFWGILVVSALLTIVAIAFIQVPLQYLVGNTLSRFYSQQTLVNWMLLAGIPGIALSGFIQEGAKMVPLVIYRWRKEKNLDPKLGLCLGAVAGAGFGIFEANWIHGIVLSSGWSWQTVESNGLIALTPFLERFFAVAFHTGASALVGYGLVRGWGWQFYLIASLLHTVLNYSTLMLQAGLMSVIGVEIFIAVWSLVIIGGALWLRWGKEPATAPVADELPAPGNQD